ncbi:MAG: hypothetical protein KJZ83_08550 [Burkholderiaceae bacterium]|nr:hypothetical protein [Burkholderiaceae bacterium]
MKARELVERTREHVPGLRRRDKPAPLKPDPLPATARSDGEPALPLLPTMGVGSVAVPGWFGLVRRQMREGAFGPDDVEELYADAEAIAVSDQIEAGLDIVSDGEVRRQRFIFEMHDRFSGLERVEASRKLGIYGMDQVPQFTVTGSIDAPRGLGVLEDYRRLRALAPGRALKVSVPGPLTLASLVHPSRRSQESVLDDFVRVVRREVERLLEAGARRIQIDEPVLAHPTHGLSPVAAGQVINRCMEGTTGRFSVHLCFGNYGGRPAFERSYAKLMPSIETLICHELVMEFANREMSEIELLAGLSSRFEIAAGVIDVKSFHLESPEQVARRIEQVLKHVAPGKLSLTADCGFSALPRALARAKMAALVAGARAARGTPVDGETPGG